MVLHPEWSDLALRIFCTVVAGGLIGLDRGEHARPAGLRTTMLLSVAACLAMIQANLLLATAGKGPTFFVNVDVMRLPLGILSGMGFIGAGAIVRRENLVLGVTTAATLWFVTIIGLIFGGGQMLLGVIGSLLGIAIVSGLRKFEKSVKQDRQGTLRIVSGPNGPTEQDVCTTLQKNHFRVNSFTLVLHPGDGSQELSCQVNWHGTVLDPTTPSFVRTLSSHPAVISLSWTPLTR